MKDTSQKSLNPMYLNIVGTIVPTPSDLHSIHLKVSCLMFMLDNRYIIDKNIKNMSIVHGYNQQSATKNHIDNNHFVAKNNKDHHTISPT